MTDAPERIWVAPWREGDWSEGDWDDNDGKTLNDKPCIQYVRADLIQPMIDKAVAEALERAAEGLHSTKLIPHDDCWANAQEAIRAMIPKKGDNHDQQ